MKTLTMADVSRAEDYAAERIDGETLEHSRRIARKAHEQKLGIVAVISAILHDVAGSIENASERVDALEDIRDEFGREVSIIVARLTRMPGLIYVLDYIVGIAREPTAAAIKVIDIDDNLARGFHACDAREEELILEAGGVVNSIGGEMPKGAKDFMLAKQYEIARAILLGVAGER